MRFLPLTSNGAVLAPPHVPTRQPNAVAGTPPPPMPPILSSTQ